MPEKQPKKRCFVIMPFSETTPEHTEAYWTEHFEVFLKPLIEEHPELGVHRSEPIRTDIVKQIISDLLTCDVVVADLTDYNPNVFWELGIRQSFKSGTITIAQNNTRLPFDIDKKGTQFYYPNNHTKMEHFRKNFKEAIMDCLDHPEKCDSPILESVTGRGTIFQMFQHGIHISMMYQNACLLSIQKQSEAHFMMMIFFRLVFQLQSTNCLPFST